MKHKEQFLSFVLIQLRMGKNDVKHGCFVIQKYIVFLNATHNGIDISLHVYCS